MTQRYVYGVYSSYMDAESKADELTTKGVPHESISLVAKKPASEYSGGRYDYLSTEDASDDRNWFQKLFGLDDNDGGTQDLDFSQYEDSLNNDQVLVIIDRDYERLINDYRDTKLEEIVDAPPVDETTYSADKNIDRVAPMPAEDQIQTDDLNDGMERRLDGDNERVRLHEEELDIHKQKKKTGEVEITKHVVEDTKTVEVPVEREELHIKHVTPAEDSNDPNAFVEEEIDIPLSEEEIVVDKKTHLVDEVEIEKKSHVDHENVTGTTRREELEITDKTDRVHGDKIIEDDNDRKL